MGLFLDERNLPDVDDVNADQRDNRVQGDACSRMSFLYLRLDWKSETYLENTADDGVTKSDHSTSLIECIYLRRIYLRLTKV